MACMLIGVIAAMKVVDIRRLRSRAGELRLEVAVEYHRLGAGHAHRISGGPMAAHPDARPAVLRRPNQQQTFPMNGGVVPLVRGAVEGDGDERLQAAAAALLEARGGLSRHHHRAVGDGRAGNARQFPGNSWFFYLMLLGIMAPSMWWVSASRLSDAAAVTSSSPGTPRPSWDPCFVDAAVRLPDHTRGIQSLQLAGGGGSAHLGCLSGSPPSGASPSR